MCIIAQKIAQYHIRVRTVCCRYHWNGLLVNNVCQRLYNRSACVKDRICLMVHSHVKYNGSSCAQDKISCGKFICEEHGSVCVQKIYIYNTFALGLYHKCVFTRQDFYFGVSSRHSQLLSNKLRYNLLYLSIHYSTHWIDSATVLLHKVKTFLRHVLPVKTYIIVDILID